MELKDILAYTGIEAENLDDFKAKFNEKFVSDEKQAIQKWLKPIVGQKFGKVKQNLLAKAREEGIEFTNSEFENIDLEEVHHELSNRKASKLKTELEQLRSKAGANGDEVVKEWQEKYEKAAQRAAEEEKLRKQLAGEFEGFKSTAANEVKSVKLNYLKNDLMGKLKFKNGISELEKTGFHAHVDKNFKFDFDDTGKAFVMDSEGNRIRSSKKADEFKSPDEVLNEVALQYNVLAQNPEAGKPKPAAWQPPTPSGQPAQPAANGQPPVQAKRRINPMFD